MACRQKPSILGKQQVPVAIRQRDAAGGFEGVEVGLSHPVGTGRWLNVAHLHAVRVGLLLDEACGPVNAAFRLWGSPPLWPGSVGGPDQIPDRTRKLAGRQKVFSGRLRRVLLGVIFSNA
ncbi:hypothetical protein GCM10008955_29360 [Deinococcus malanensis]|uniref:Uncharacterized protein n=1 Tax=Deinococcus malanensis TaxID=1706855 RepID=A0ABQ2EZF8_9DEIO|nr:hypothetical protein GCM10008955_29360 [Deinococcus malanensis]